MSVFEDMEFAVSNERVMDNDSVSVDDEYVITELETCVSRSDFEETVKQALTDVMGQADILASEVGNLSDFFVADWLTVMNYHLNPTGGAWVDQMITLFHWLQTASEDKARALLQLIESHGWFEVMPDFVSDTDEFFESYEGTFEDKEDFAKQYGEMIAQPLTQWWEGFVQWDAVIGYLDRQGYMFMEDTETYKFHVWSNNR